jgi:membrane fusion protein, multidrug efflux system
MHDLLQRYCDVGKVANLPRAGLFDHRPSPGQIGNLPHESLLHVACCALLLLLTMAGCDKGQAAPTKKPALTEVVVSQPVVKEVTDYEYFVGRTEAKARVEVRARVSGYLDKVFFREGDEVKEGDPLFAIDDRSYHAERDQKKAALAQAEAHLKRLESDYKRASDLLPQNAISQTEFDQISGDRDEAVAAVKLAQAALDMAQLNLDWTRVNATLDGRIGKQMIDPGNMVQADLTPLTTIVSQDPVYAYFDVDERTTLKVRRMIRSGNVKSWRDASMPVYLKLADEPDTERYPHEGTINFSDNQLDPMTGTLRLRGSFPSLKRILSPGLYVRIQLPIGRAHPATLIPEDALGTDQGKKFVYVVNDKNEIEYRPVTLGKLQDRLRVIEDDAQGRPALKPGERVVIEGLQKIKQGTKVQIKDSSAERGPGSKPPAAKKPGAAAGSRPSS